MHADMSSPRFLRPHTITVRNFGPEVDNEATYTDTVFQHVKFDGSYGITLGSRGVDTTDTVLIIVDCHDYEAQGKKLVLEHQYDDPDTQVCFRTNDVILYNGQEYEISQVKVTDPFGTDPEFLEVTCA